MTVFDTDILSDLADGVPAVVARATTIPRADQCAPVVAVQEILRGQLAGVRRAEAGGKVPLPTAYQHFTDSLTALRQFRLLPYTDAADALFRSWRAAKIRIGTRDLRIAAIAFAHGAKLTTRNARDFRLVPGLDLDVWS